MKGKTQILLMKPKAQGPHDEGFLEYLEDIIGTNKYVEKFDEASKQWVQFASYLSESLPSYSCLLHQYPIFNEALCLLLVLVLMLIGGIILVS